MYCSKSVRLLSGQYKPVQLKWCKCEGRAWTNTSTQIWRLWVWWKNSPWEIYLPWLDHLEGKNLKEAWFNCREVQWWHCCVNSDTGSNTVILATPLENSSRKDSKVSSGDRIMCKAMTEISLQTLSLASDLNDGSNKDFAYLRKPFKESHPWLYLTLWHGVCACTCVRVWLTEVWLGPGTGVWADYNLNSC